MGWAAGLLRSLLLLLNVGGAQVMATGKSTGAEADIKYGLIGTALGVAISAGFLALKICMIRKHLLDYDSADLRSANVGVDDTIAPRKRAPRSNLNSSEREAQVIEL
ncbi:transmembrane protein 273 [Eptesicus fuscus]|uniref:transmembrane protein 273 n=1 Tax=Eptesicus fuscus TaxID=29078 RepID=UPI00240487FD|nr:transmembrane protein 273 [Eptesicus fuscus]